MTYAGHPSKGSAEMRSIAAQHVGSMPTENGSGKERLTIRLGLPGWIGCGVGLGFSRSSAIPKQKMPPDCLGHSILSPCVEPTPCFLVCINGRGAAVLTSLRLDTAGGAKCLALSNYQPNPIALYAEVEVCRGRFCQPRGGGSPCLQTVHPPRCDHPETIGVRWLPAFFRASAVSTPRVWKFRLRCYLWSVLAGQWLETLGGFVRGSILLRLYGAHELSYAVAESRCR